MNRRMSLLLTVGLMITMLWGCSENTEPTTPPTAAENTTVPTQAVEYTSPPDGNPENVTCRGSYTEDERADAVVARVGEAELTNEQLRAWYWLEAATYASSGAEPCPDPQIPLDCQSCPLDGTVNTWQQYFLKQALTRWHSAQALALQARQEGIPLESAYKPNKEYHEKNLQNIPATRFLYGYNQGYQPNTMHQAYLDQVPGLLETLAGELGYRDSGDLAHSAAGTQVSCLEEAVKLYNLGYMYLTTLSYEISIPEEDVQAYLESNSPASETGITQVDIRHILLTPDQTDSDWELCRETAEKLLKDWEKEKNPETSFAVLACAHSQDPGSAPVGGAYYGLTRGQLWEALDAWCFDPARLPGDTELIRSDAGWHVMYFVRTVDSARREAMAALTRQKQAACIDAAREKYPMTVDYSSISLTEASPRLDWDALLYPDVAHERFPEVPLYLQQDYAGTMYGSYPVATHGCGITSMAMLASYMTDDELTVPEMCSRFGRYCLETGTNYTIFQLEPPGMGFFLKAFVKTADEAKEALKNGHIVVSLQHRGYWTRGGHFIVIEEITEDDMVRVRDSNLYNYGKLEAHEQDLHEWSSVTARSAGYWIYEKKVTSIAACSRCGGQAEPEGIPVTDYLCHKCEPALLRRDVYLNYAS